MPPLGMNVSVVRSIAPDRRLNTIVAGSPASVAAFFLAIAS
jgi:hypothetical protein